MSERVASRRVAGMVMYDFGDTLSAIVEQASAPDAVVFQADDAMLTARNAALLVLAGYVGRQKLYEGALYRMQAGDPFVHYQSEEHLQDLIGRRKSMANLVAELACKSCPFKMECGVGPEQLQAELRDKATRSRFRDRFRRQPLNNRMCSRNLSPQRIVPKQRAA